METVSAALERAVDQLLGRASGPFHLRLLLQPTMATLLAIRAGLRDAREGWVPFLWTFFTDPVERSRLLHSAWKDIGKLLAMALVLDVAYQIVTLKAFFLLQTVIVVLVLAILPYAILRGIVGRLAQKRNKPTN
jgi:hypothetical protein